MDFFIHLGLYLVDAAVGGTLLFMGVTELLKSYKEVGELKVNFRNLWAFFMIAAALL